MSSLLYIPTNRPALRSVERYAYECDWLTRSGNWCAFALIEARDGHHVEDHRQLILELASDLSSPVHHFDLTGQRHFLHALARDADLSAADATFVERCLIPPETDYSAGPSKAALLSCALGARWLHRRDSDTEPQVMNGEPLYPSGLEVDSLDRPLGSLPEVDPGDLPPHLPVTCIGTDYEGDQALDREAFRALPLEILVEHERLENPGLDRATLEGRVHRKYLAQDREPYQGDQLVLDDLGRSEMGAFSVSRLHRIIPELPMPATLGSDYFVKNLGYRLGMPILYHSRKVAHSHGNQGGRAAGDAAGFVDYSLKDARFKLMKIFWRRLNQALSKAAKEREGQGELFTSRRYADCIDCTLESTSDAEVDDLLAAIVTLYERAAAVAIEANASGAHFLEVASRLCQESDGLRRAPRQAFEDFVRLTRLWPRLVDAADALYQRGQAP